MSYKAAMEFSKCNSNQISKTQLWSSTETMKYVTSYVEGLIKKQIELIDSYDLVQVNSNTWWSIFNGLCNECDDNKSISKLIPNFRRVRVIKLEKDNTLHCSCHIQDRFRIPCGHIIKINEGLVKATDVCVSNYIEYAQMYSDIRFSEITKEFNERMNEYNGPHYHRSDKDIDLIFPIYECVSKDNENYEHFHNGDIHYVDITNYNVSMYQHLIRQNNETATTSESNRDSDYIGYSQEHFTQEEERKEAVFEDSFQAKASLVDPYSVLAPLMKEMVDLIGKDEYLLSYASEEMSSTLNNLLRKRKEVDNERISSKRKDVQSEWVSCTVTNTNKRSFKKQKYNLSQGG